MDSFYTRKDLEGIGFKSIGENLFISRKASFYSPENIVIGNNVRIDDFCILSGSITLGNYIHISAYTALYGKFGIELEDYSGLSPRCLLFSSSDDFSGNFLVGPLIPLEYTNQKTGKIIFKKFSHACAGTIIMPGVCFNEGAVAGAMSFVKQDLQPWSIYGGFPLKLIKQRNNDLIQKSFYTSGNV